MADQIGKIRLFFSNALRVLKLTKKPKRDDFVFVAKVTGLGILLIGFLGYVIESLRWLLK
jgi:protein transport protein SEC61 subunit gamma-like protein